MKPAMRDSPIARMRRRDGRHVPGAVVLTVVVVLAALIMSALVSRVGVTSDRIRNPDVIGAPRPVNYLFGVSSSTWIIFGLIGNSLVILGIAVACVSTWQRHPRHPVVLMVIAATLLVWLDPVMNWMCYAGYNPQLPHLPEDWPLVSMSPVIEPLIVLTYAIFFVAPYFPAIAVLRRIQARRGPESFPSRHPLLSLTVLILAFGAVYDIFLELFIIGQGVYIYSQVVPFGSVFVGTPFQFPLLWQLALVTPVMIAAGVLLYRDDTGRTTAEKLALRARIFGKHTTIGMFVTMFFVLNLAYSVYAIGFGTIRAMGMATSVACPWPYPEAKTYDPQGVYAMRRHLRPEDHC